MHEFDQIIAALLLSVFILGCVLSPEESTRVPVLLRRKETQHCGRNVARDKTSSLLDYFMISRVPRIQGPTYSGCGELDCTHGERSQSQTSSFIAPSG